MAQTVNIPRFYVNALEWLSFNGELPDMSELFRTLPVKQTAGESYTIDTAYDLVNPFCFILGHSGLASDDETSAIAIFG